MAMKNPPRRTTIRGQKHLLAYITPEEADVLKAMGGSGEKVHGIPAFFDPGERDQLGGAQGNRDVTGRGGGGNDRDSQGRDRALEAAKAERAARDAAEAALAEPGPASGGISPGQSQAMFGTSKYAGLGTEQAISAAKLSGNEFAGGVEKARAIDIASLQNLNRQLENLSLREQIQKDRINSLYSLIPGVGLANYLGLQNVRNLASAAIGQPPGLLSGLGLGAFGFGDRISPDFRGLGVSDLIGLQSQAVTNDMGNIVGFRDESGTLKYGRDPNEPMFDDGSGRDDTVPASYNPNTGDAQCPDGYMFDEDLQACRLAGGLPGGDGTGGVGTTPYTGDLYGRMGLLDIAPTGLGMFKERFGAGFGTPSEFDAANTAFRRGGGVMQQHPGYTLLS